MDWMFRNPSETWTPVIVLSYALFAPPAAAQMSRLGTSVPAVSTMSIEKMRFPMQLPLM